MELGGLKQMYLFPDMLTKGKSYFGEITGIKETVSKTGKPLTFVVFVTTLDDGFPNEYLVSAWNIRSEKPFDPSKAARFWISNAGKKTWFKPAEEQQ